MGIIKDFRDDHQGQVFKSKVRDSLSPEVWFRLHERRKQRADRGWADQDAWGMGEHIAQITVDMLKHLRKKGVTDWDKWFEYNIDEKGKGAYKNLTEVIDDIENYLKFSRTTWADNLKSVTGSTGKYSISWVNQKGKKITEAEITNRINKHSKEEVRLYKKATKAMSFFGRHFAQFWD